jgi:hypothetical protein
MQLSKNFWLKEFTASATAERYGLSNWPNDLELDNLRALVENIAQPVRDHFGRPVGVSSGYRSTEVNAQIGGAMGSQHTRGEAFDFEIPGVDNREVAMWIQENLEFDQLILEFFDERLGINSGWIHASYTTVRPNRRETLAAVKKSGRTVYIRTGNYWVFE